jgi:hypothetical protein
LWGFPVECLRIAAHPLNQNLKLHALGVLRKARRLCLPDRLAANAGNLARNSMLRNEAEEHIKTLATYYPKTFFETGSRRTPLKVGIHLDLLKQGPLTDLSAVEDVLWFYENHIGYSHNMRAGTPRLDLEGQPM